MIDFIKNSYEKYAAECGFVIIAVCFIAVSILKTYIDDANVMLTCFQALLMPIGLLYLIYIICKRLDGFTRYFSIMAMLFTVSLVGSKLGAHFSLLIFPIALFHIVCFAILINVIMNMHKMTMGRKKKRK